MESKVHPAIHLSIEMRKHFLRKTITAYSGFHKTKNALAGAELALLAIFQMLRTGLLGIPGLARYMQVCRRTRDNPHADLLWRLFVRARYPYHPFERNDRVPRGLFSSIDPNTIRIDKSEHRMFPCSTQFNTCNLRGRNDFKILCTTEQSVAIMRGAKNDAAFAGGLFPWLFKTAKRKQIRRRREHERKQRKQRQKSGLNDVLVVIDLCRPYLVQTFTAKGCDSPDSLHIVRAPSADQTESGHSFWSGRTENFENPTDYRIWWCRMQRLRIKITRALAPIETAHKDFLIESNNFVKAMRTEPPEPEGFTCGKCTCSNVGADKCTRPIYYVTLVVCFPFMLSWNLEQASLLKFKAPETTTPFPTNPNQSTDATIFYDMCFHPSGDNDLMNWLYVFVIPGLVSGIPAFLAFIGRALSIFIQWWKFKKLLKSKVQKRKNILAFMDNLRYPVDRDANSEPQHTSESNLTTTCDAASNLNQCNAVDPSVVAAVEDGLGVPHLESRIFDLDHGDAVRLNTRPCLCACALDLFVWIWGCLSAIIGVAAQWCRQQKWWNPLFVLGIAAILVVADALFLVLAYLYNQSKPGSWKYLSFLYMMTVLQHVVLLSLFLIGVKTVSFFIVFAPLFLNAIAILFLCCVFYKTKKGVIIIAGIGLPLLVTLSLVCLKADLLFNDSPALPKEKRFITWLDTYWPVWSILVLWPMIAWFFDRVLRCNGCIIRLDNCFFRIQVWFST